MACAVVVQELLGEVAPAAGHCSSTSNAAIHQESTVLRQRTELRQDVLASSNHLLRIISGDVGREQLGATSLLDASPHGLHHLRNALVHLAENLVALGLIVLDEVTSLPERVAGLFERLGLHCTRFRMDPCRRSYVYLTKLLLAACALLSATFASNQIKHWN